MLDWFYTYPDFREKYETALKLMAVVLGVELLHIHQIDGGYYAVTEDGSPVFDYARARVASDNIKWFLARILHGTYGDRVQHTGKDGKRVDSLRENQPAAAQSKPVRQETILGDGPRKPGEIGKRCVCGKR